MSLTKTARFPGRVEKRRKGALARLEINLKSANREATEAVDNGERDDINPKKIAVNRVERISGEIATLKKHLRIHT